MRTCFLAFRLILLFWLASLPPVVLAQSGLPAALAGRTQPGTLIIKLKPNYPTGNRRQAPSGNATTLSSALAQINATRSVQKYPRALTYPNLKPNEVDLSLIFQVFYADSKLTFARIRQILLATGLVEYVEPVNIPELLYQPNDPLADSIKGAQYYLKQIQAYKGWSVQKGDSNIVIGILDTGTRLTHEDLRQSIKHNYADPIDGLDNDQDGYIDNFNGWDLADNDNDPTAQNNHGVLVTGIAVATPDNGKGIAGVGYYCRYLPVKVFSSAADGNFGGYEGIVYAADHGCQVINLSWGGAVAPSRYEQDIINYAAINKNAVVVAAGGNTPRELKFYPASYDNVLSVIAVDQKDVKGTSQTFNYALDLTAAGVAVRTTASTRDDTYANSNGSSMASPIVAGCAALLRRQFPEYTSAQIAERLRMTADDIYAVGSNGKYHEKLGRGRVNLYKALTTPQVKAVRNLQNTYPATTVYPGDTLAITGTFQNILAPVSNLVISLNSSSPYVTILEPDFAVGALPTHQIITNSRQFKVLLRPDTPVNETITLRYNFSANNYSDYQYFTITVNPDYLTLTAGNLAATVTSQGNIGYNGLNHFQGEGVNYRNWASLLSESGLMVGTGPTRVADNIRNERNQSDSNFTAIANLKWAKTGKQAHEEAYGTFQDQYPARGHVGIRVKQRAFAWQNAPDNDFVILEYTLTNTTDSLFTDLYAGLFADWDVRQANRNVAAWDSIQQMGYVYQPDRPNLYAGLALLTPQLPTYYALHNLTNSADTINLADGFTTAEKYAALSNTDRAYYQAGGAGSDVSQVVGGHVKGLAPGQSTTVAFALLGNQNIPGLQQATATARQKYRALKTSPLPLVTDLNICPGSTATLSPRGGSIFKFYTDVAGQHLVETGATFTTPPLTRVATYYISNVDSLFASPLVAVIISPAKPAVQFSFTPNPVLAAAKGTVFFTDETSQARQWRWSFGNGTQSEEQNPEVKYTQPGQYAVKLIVMNQYGCTDSLTRTIEIKYTDYLPVWTEKEVAIYPNPTPGLLNIGLSDGINPVAGIHISLVDLLGRVILQTTTYQTGLLPLNLSYLSNGIYFVRIRSQNGAIVRRVELLRK